MEREAARDRGGLPVRMELIKRTPVGGGLGGGSSDAAAMMMGVNELFELGMSCTRLERVEHRAWVGYRVLHG